ncbi:MAG: hypothetical protein ACOX0Z_01415 [Candidatus Nanosyncoccaceae bacterium]|jgi:hypothetical protein
MSLKNGSSKNQSVPSKRKRTAIVTTALLLAAVILIVLIANGVIKLSGGETAKETKPCGNDIIKTYNDTRIALAGAGTWPAELVKLGERIRRIENHEDDIDCAYILMQDSMERRRWSVAYYYLSIIKDKMASSSNDKVSEKLTTLTPKQLEDYLDYAFLMDEDSDAEGGK